MAIVAYIIVSIITLTEISFDDYYRMCESSHIIAYSIYTIVTYVINITDKDNNSYDVFITFELLKMTVTVLWGPYELFFQPCIAHERIWQLCFAFWLFHTIVLGSMTCLVFGLVSLNLIEICKDYCKKPVHIIRERKPPPTRECHVNEDGSLGPIIPIEPELPTVYPETNANSTHHTM